MTFLAMLLQNRCDLAAERDRGRSRGGRLTTDEAARNRSLGQADGLACENLLDRYFQVMTRRRAPVRADAVLIVDAATIAHDCGRIEQEGLGCALGAKQVGDLLPRIKK